MKTLSEAVDKLEDMRESIADIKTEMAQSEEHPTEKYIDGAEVVEPQIVSKAEKRLTKKVKCNSFLSQIQSVQYKHVSVLYSVEILLHYIQG